MEIFTLFIFGAILGLCVSEPPQIDRRYACEGKTLNIECNNGSVIRLIRANYGRFLITICNKNGNTNWNTNCFSTQSMRVVHNRCHMKQSCSLLANAEFGDPCPGTDKYLEIHYHYKTANYYTILYVRSPTTTTTESSAPPAWFVTVPTN
ncbi:unnamed protein product [Pieris macdunnoughi]|uniref:SUEL-type lectin domain-containing protein n=1 Tax=Pieris macdunnoughi TaxID=345717 RepID=A0A821WEQ0_9NEOP|nr:unnamed protein product [Pieris macdunnoughi]